MMTPFDCPRCGTVLTMSDRQGIEIDYCPQCRGVWLDRGELDKIGERVAAAEPPPVSQPSAWTQAQAAPQPSWTAPRDAGRPYKRDDDWDRQDDYKRGKPRKHWLSDLFD